VRVILATHGTTGDVQPLLALALALEERGHEAVLAAPPNFAPRADALNVRFRGLGPEVERERFHAAFSPLATMADPAEQARSTVGMLEETAQQMYEDLLAECRTADVLVNFPFQIAGTMVRDSLDIRFASIHFSPFGTGNKRLAVTTAPIVNRARSRAGLGPLDDPLGADAFSDQLAIFAVSPQVFRRPTRWPEHFQLTGYAFLDEPFEPSAALADFLAAGDPPVVFSFGSVVHVDPEDVTVTLLEAIQRAGCRAIIQHGWSGLANDALPDQVLALGDTPHSWLFPRAACVAHACGAGTTAATLRSGVPALPVPHWLDQPLWAHMVRELGCAETVLPFRSMTAESLADAVGRTLASDRVKEKSAEMGRKVRAENGLARIVELLEQLG
jgi:UDP:flavonoid glycosyltransferase YjiC (YdhE family)